MNDYLLDTNHASWLMANNSLLAQWSRQAGSAESRLGISVTVLAELYYAVYASQRRYRNLSLLHQLVDSVFFWEFDSFSAEEFGKIQAEQKLKGRPIPPMDAQIAAVARVNKLTLLTADHHFQYIDGLSVVNWLKST